MKTGIRILTQLIVLSGAFTMASAFGQTTYTWIGSNGGDIAASTNWSPNGQPSGATGDIAEWDGQTVGPVTVAATGNSLPSVGFGSLGINLYFSANQISSVTFTSTVAPIGGSAGCALDNIIVEAGAGAVTIGATGGADELYLYNFYARPAGAVHHFLNNSTNPATINGTVRWEAGGGAVYTLDFDGPGDWIVNNYLDDDAIASSIQKDGSGMMYWTPTGYLGNGGFISPIVINAGTLILKGYNPYLRNVTITNNGIFQFDAPAQTQTLSGGISGSGILQVNNGVLVVNGMNMAASTTIVGGTLGGSGTFTGPITLDAGTTLAPGSQSSIGTMTVSNDVTIGGNILIKVNTTLAQSNDMAMVSGALSASGSGTLTVTNLGPNLVAGDKFILFSKALQNGAALTVIGAGANWTNNLAVDGSISVSSLILPPTLNFTNVGNNSLQFSWTGGFKLQVQTNSINVGLSNNWVDYPGGDVSGITVPIDVTNGTVFFRLAPTL